MCNFVCHKLNSLFKMTPLTVNKHTSHFYFSNKMLRCKVKLHVEAVVWERISLYTDRCMSDLFLTF